MMGGTFSFAIYLIIWVFSNNLALNQVIGLSPTSWLQEHASDMAHSICSWVPSMSHVLLPRINPICLIAIAGYGCVILTDVIIEIK